MPGTNSTTERPQEAMVAAIQGTIEEIARVGAQRLLQRALEVEVEEHLARYEELRGEGGRQAVVRNGHAPERTVYTGVGPVNIRRPRVDERAAKGSEDHEPFSSGILPRFLRRTPTLAGALAVLYLKGISTNDFPTALSAILGESAKGLSASTITRLKSVWEQEYDQWRRQPLGSQEYAYVWADGVYCNVRLDDERSCILVAIGANFQGEKQLLAVQDGYRESKESWKELLLDVKHRGLRLDPRLIIGDGGLGLWAALPEVYPSSKHQRCWVHKTMNVLDKLPSSVQGRAKAMLHDIYLAETKRNAEAAFDHFIETFTVKFPKATECLTKDREELLAFYAFPAEHWQHIRSTNVIESVFATVRLRTKKTKGCGTRIATLTMVFKLIEEAAKTWRRIDASEKLHLVQKGRRFIDGELVEEPAA